MTLRQAQGRHTLFFFRGGGRAGRASGRAGRDRHVKRGVGFFKPLRDLDLLGALGQTFLTLNALVGALVLRDAERPIVHELPRTHIVVHNSVVIDLKDTGDLHPIGAGLAIAAAGTGDGAKALIGRLDLSDDLEVGGGIKAGAGLARYPNVIHDLRHCAHAG